jgi:Ca2+-binding RTX toxin-like protein
MGRIKGTAKSETIYGTKRDDTIYGEGGNDTIYGGAGNDYVRGGTGNDILHGEDGNDTLVANEGTYHELYGGAGDDLFSGGRGYDLLEGGTGNDTLHGGAGADDVHGGDGNDTLNGELGADDLVGGAGADRFYYASTADSALSHPEGGSFEIGVDTIHDFNVADGDWLDLSWVDANENTTGDQSFAQVDAFTGVAGQLTLSYDADAQRTIVSGDTNGDGLADLVIYIAGVDVSAGGDWLVS